MKGLIVMTAKTKRNRNWGITLLVVFSLWTFLLRLIDVQPQGPNNSMIGFASLNKWFYRLTGFNESLYRITSSLEKCLLGAGLLLWCVLLILFLASFFQRKNNRRKDYDLEILPLTIYYVIIVICYLFFEKAVTINFRPILIDGILEPSYPSTTTLIVLGFTPVLLFHFVRRVNLPCIVKIANVITVLFCVFMVTGRLISGVHWATDIIASIFLSLGLFFLYRAMVFHLDYKNMFLIHVSTFLSNILIKQVTH